MSKAAIIWIDYHKAHSKKNTERPYHSVIDRFCQDFGDCEIDQITPDVDAGILLGRDVDGDVIFHDLRRTCKTNILAVGVDRNYRDLIIGHAMAGMDRHYIDPTDEQLTAAMAKFTV